MLGSIMFGKFYQSHVCNLKEFKVLGGLDPDGSMIELLHSGLKNDSEPEVFPLKHHYKEMVFPVQYIKIIPLAAYGTSFNFSIWYLEVTGISEKSTVHKISEEYEAFKDMETMRLCLKYFRQKNLMDVFHLLKNRIDVELEHPIISSLHHQLVLVGDFDTVEKTLETLFETEVFESHCQRSPYTAIWKRMSPIHENEDIVPCGRGGHQMCIDIEERMIYVLGGYDGKCDLSDFWCYDIAENSWLLLSSDTESELGPGPRSCHKMCYDPQSDAIYVLGRYVNSPEDNIVMLQPDLFKYSLKDDSWVKLSSNTADDGGPELVFDHQMCVDSKNGIIYVCGGKVISRDCTSPSYSGLYAYKIETNEWDILRSDDANTSDGTTASRVGHSTVIDEGNNSLYIFAGQRSHECFYDLFKYNISQNLFTEIDHRHKDELSGEAGFTHRVTFDEKLQEMYIFASYTRSTRWERIKNVFYVYSLRYNTWQKVYEHEILDCLPSNPGYPIPRYAHQMVYDPSSKTHYVFGGNPGNDKNSRLNDLWELKLKKPEPADILRQCLFMVRMQKLKELCRESYKRCQDNGNMKKTSAALNYLRTRVTPLVDYEDEGQVSEFQEMCTSVCLLGSSTEQQQTYLMKLEANLYTERSQLFERLLKYIPQEMKEPVEKLTNTIKMI
ncbi:hypothetical protein G6F45_008610 [Rhizopus arrhizus]|nr:hypothetical protein G6F49_008590 [Rhizopus delemar]KAG1626165.1 hypothetical protein G6F45_008610 [Rhizopus arrhizus]